ncbi:RING finger protein nhl-1-like protein [Dinothrombium tinctorium]|uniref:RING finger protein nhl-1-like protein n=1 Tax=Dinothrombium tinctorium TaxID=1965070 RepID=A0A3S3REI0_9ACAR|nr:RING finger protein nhl-1-like protein [Dinothrombium tinctorium]
MEKQSGTISTVAEEEEHSAILQKEYEEVKRDLMQISQQKSKMEEIYKSSRRRLVREIKRKENAVESALLCRICYDKMVRPFTLPCQHTFCIECIRKLSRNQENYGLCPFCSKPFRLPQTVTEYNYVIEDIKSIFG